MKSALLLTLTILVSLAIATTALKCYSGIQQTGTGTITTIIEVSNSTLTNYVCARYEQSVSFVTQKVFTYTDKATCDNWLSITTFQKVYCCNTDLCNGGEHVVGSALMIGLAIIASFILL
ncbi:predicted protein [Naegleria gruberi]|uniref:Predicted protein n=1 Tax=Naegleria gruberi TaxID=5762 RepID=D2V868_NAEGR|nr:uncharacterized protein NAEGRDRAFT_65048 [Naegleria gruberi]EFC46994.1 predicted protein [Naegleria gruberi]|eukprot:XP_002679738.1 predicted protein [Naegleria gruberi strain NEG-M]